VIDLKTSKQLLAKCETRFMVNAYTPQPKAISTLKKNDNECAVSVWQQASPPGNDPFHGWDTLANSLSKTTSFWSTGKHTFNEL